MAMIQRKFRLGGLSLLALSALSCDQPPADCTTGHGPFAAVYTLQAKEGTGACDRLIGELIGLEKYNPSQASDPKKQDLTTAKLRIRAAGLTEQAEEEGSIVEVEALDSLGDFVSATPDAENVCSVPTLTPASISVALGPGLPATARSYTWSNVKVYVTTAYPGTQMTADLVYSEGDCSATYKVVGLWPAVSCGVDEDGNGQFEKVDPTLCDPAADPAAGRATGSGINPDFKDRVVCNPDPDFAFCVLKEVPEALK
jgi:hypothetical protein